MCKHSCRGGFPGVWLLALVVVAGCRPHRAPDQLDGVKLDFAVAPSPPTEGPEKATVTLADAEGKPIRGASVKLEGDMNHAGMTPVFADATEKAPGRYEGTLDLTMGGDWFVLIDVSLADGRTLKKKVDLPGVKSR